MSPDPPDPRAPQPTLAAPTRSTVRRWLSAALSVGSLAVLFGPGVLEHARFAADRWHFNDDARAQIPPLLRFADPRLFHEDYIADHCCPR